MWGGGLHADDGTPKTKRKDLYMTYIEKQEKLQAQAVEFCKKHTRQEAYDFATWILHELEEKNFCIWQTYTKDDVKLGTGKRPTDEEFCDMQERLQNCFYDIV